MNTKCRALVTLLAFAGGCNNEREISSYFHYTVTEDDWEVTEQGLRYTVEVDDTDKSMLPPDMQYRMTWQHFLDHFDEIDSIRYTDGWFEENVDGRGSLSLQFVQDHMTLSRGQSRTSIMFDPMGSTYYGFPGNPENLLGATVGDDLYFPDFHLVVLLEDAEVGPTGTFSVNFTGIGDEK